MISYQEAVELIRRHSKPLPKERVALEDAGGRVIAEDLRTLSAIPRFDASAVDGYAIQSAASIHATAVEPVPFTIVAMIRAGDAKRRSGGERRAIRIFTGAPMPPDCDAVVMQEDVALANGSVMLHRPLRVGENVRKQGEEFARGDIVIPRGAVVTPPVLGLIATIGRHVVSVTRQPRVALIVTGSELCPPGERPGRGQIFDSNTSSIAGALAAIGIDPIVLPTVADDEQALHAAMEHGLKEADLLITVGGVSVGDFDFVRSVSTRLRVREMYWSVAIKPGKPSFFGVRGRRLLFGLPGNPVAALLSFRLFVVPALEGLCGREITPPLLVQATLSASIRKKVGRQEFVRAVVVASENGELHVRPLVARDSHMLSGLALANSLIHFPAEQSQLAAGDSVTVSFLQWMER